VHSYGRSTLVLFLESLVSAALPRLAVTVDDDSTSPLSGLMTHLDAVYAFALALTSRRDLAEDLTETVYRDVTRDLWSTLGGHGLRERLLARCLSIFGEQFGESVRADGQGDGPDIPTLLAGLPRDERAAVALVDRLGLTYAAGAAVMGSPVNEFRAILHRGRAVLIAASRTATAL
jgi:DNA-directed RNA polymerase specialized sigma24 family protein